MCVVFFSIHIQAQTNKQTNKIRGDMNEMKIARQHEKKTDEFNQEKVLDSDQVRSRGM